MASSEDTEITLGTGKLLVLFFGLVGICALFFALGYSLGKKSDPTMSVGSAAVAPQTTSGAKASSGAAPATAPPMTFYKSVEQKDANPQLTPATDAKTDTAGTPAGAASATGTPGQTSPGQSAPSQSASAQATSTQSTSTQSTSTQAGAGNAPDPAIAMPGAGYFVQVAAVSKQEDADSLVEALKKKQYPALVAAQVPTDKLFRVQVGPFSDIKDAEATRTRLIGDGYSPILKK
jgi:DedD protein